MSVDMKPSEVLRKARELITPEGAWIQGDAARDSSGIPVTPKHRNAVCFCSEGALSKASNYNLMSGVGAEALVFLERASNRPLIYVWNDDNLRTQTDVLKAFDNAAALAEAEGN